MEMPKTVDHDHFREELLERCFSIFSRKGYSKVSIREIAKETGVSTGTLYHYFDNKENILEQMFSYIRRKNFNQYLNMSEGVDHVEDRIKMITGFWKEHMEEYQNLILLAIDYMRAKPSSKTYNVFHDFADFYIHALSDTLEMSIQETTMLYIYLIGLVFNSLLIPGIVKPDEQVTYLYEVLRILKKKEANSRGRNEKK
jgi:AcrR family transcriptional regulator